MDCILAALCNGVLLDLRTSLEGGEWLRFVVPTLQPARVREKVSVQSESDIQGRRGILVVG